MATDSKKESIKDFSIPQLIELIKSNLTPENTTGHEALEHLRIRIINGTIKNEEDKKNTVNFLKTAAEQGSASAQNCLGLCYQNGVGVAKDAAEAIRLYRLAADQKFAWAIVSLANCYRDGIGIKQDSKEFYRLFHLAAEYGLPDVQNNLGVTYQNGMGVEKDEKRAFHLYSLAAAQSLPDAQCNLGVCYQHGIGVEKDAKEAFRHYHLAAEQNLPNAQCNLGVCYQHGIGVEKDAKEAFRHYHLAAEQRLARAQLSLGICHQEGIGVERDTKEAFRFYRLAAEQGLPDAQCNLGFYYEHGISVKKDLKEAIRLYQLAAAGGSTDARSNLLICQKEMAKATLGDSKTVDNVRYGDRDDRLADPGFNDEEPIDASKKGTIKGELAAETSVDRRQGIEFSDYLSSIIEIIEKNYPHVIDTPYPPEAKTLVDDARHKLDRDENVERAFYSYDEDKFMKAIEESKAYQTLEKQLLAIGYFTPKPKLPDPITVEFYLARRKDSVGVKAPTIPACEQLVNELGGRGAKFSLEKIQKKPTGKFAANPNKFNLIVHHDKNSKVPELQARTFYITARVQGNKVIMSFADDSLLQKFTKIFSPALKAQLGNKNVKTLDSSELELTNADLAHKADYTLYLQVQLCARKAEVYSHFTFFPTSVRDIIAEFHNCKPIREDGCVEELEEKEKKSNCLVM